MKTQPHSMDTGWASVQYGFRLEHRSNLIAHVVENDLPYTEILTADYIMANPHGGRSLRRRN